MLVDAGFNAITSQIIGSAIEVHRHLGPGLLESRRSDRRGYCDHDETKRSGMRTLIQ
jgi:hypothetical protein